MSLRASIIIPSYNAEATLPKTLESLMALDFPEAEHEIIVVDNASTDHTAEAAGRYPVRLVREERRGAYVARNSGIRVAQGDFLAFTDADCAVEPDWLKALLDGFDSPKVGAAGGKVTSVASNGIEAFILRKGFMDQERFFRGGTLTPPFFMTANVAYSRKAVEAVKGFDEDYAIAGDADICWRMAWAGFGLKYIPEAVVHHFHRSTREGLFKQQFQYGYGSANLFAHHRRQFGKRVWISWREYRLLARHLRLLPLLKLGRHPEIREEADLEITARMGYLAGRWYGSWRWRTLAL